MDFDSLVKLDLEKRIKATQSFFSLFGKTLTAAEIDRLIIGSKEGSQVYKAKDPENEYAKKLLLIVEKRKWVFAYIPFIKSVSLCNYLSFGIAEPGSDIDLLIIAQKDRIYLCRLYTTILLHLMGMRRHGKKVSARFCLSFYLSESNLDLAEILQNPYDIYLAYWFLGLKELANYNKGLWERLLEENKPWLSRYFDKLELRREIGASEGKIAFIRNLTEWIFNGWIGDKLELLLKWYFEQRAAKMAKMLPKSASIIVSDKMQKFHNNDRRQMYREEWEQKLNRFGLLE